MKMIRCLLGDIITFQRGYDLPRTKMEPGEYPVVGSNGIIGYHNQYTTEAPCITIGRSGNVGGPQIQFGRAWAHNTTLFVKEFKNVDPVFVYYLLLTLDLGNYAGGSAVPTLNRNHIHSLPITIPAEIETQKRIARILSSLDDKIEVNYQINRNLEEQAFSFYNNLVNEAKQQCELKSVAVLNPARSLQRGSVALCIDMAQLSTSSAYPNQGIYKSYGGGLKFQNGDTLLARITPCLENGKTAYIDFLKEGEIAFGSTEYIVLSSRGEMPPQFFYCLARDKRFRDYAIKHMNGSSGRQRVSADALEKYMIPSISKEDMRLFGQNVEPLFKLMRQKADENIRLSSLRDTLLPKLMTGEIAPIKKEL